MHTIICRGAIFDGPHMNLAYDEDRRAIVDATDLLIHHVSLIGRGIFNLKKMELIYLNVFQLFIYFRSTNMTVNCGVRIQVGSK